MPRGSWWVLLLIGCLPAGVKAHGLGIEARLLDSTVYIEAFYDNNEPVVSARVVVLAENGQEVLAGVTDAMGLWNFPAPAMGKYRIELQGEDGHFTKTLITIPAASPGSTASPDAGPIISEGLTRTERTGPRKWGMALLGLLVIALGSFAVKGVLYLRRKWQKPDQNQTEGV